MNRWVKISLAAFAIMLALGISFGTKLIPAWGRWYSLHLPCRQQTEAMLQGHIVLSPSPTALMHDRAWGRNGVQQVWGLGVPGWRLPFEAAARLFGQPGFPDRLAFAAAWALLIYLVLMTFLTPAELGTGWLTQLGRHPERLAVIGMLTMFAPILSFCRGPFSVYEEPTGYVYLYGIGLFAGLVAFLRRPRFVAYLALSLMSGLAGFIRPTAGAYGFATVTLTFFLAWRLRWRWWQVLAGPALFGLGGGLLFLSNWQRFGSGFEFGHNLNMTLPDLVYTARFGAPFAHEPFWSAAREEFGSLFQVLDISQRGFGYYGRTVVAWQSPTPRWREYYDGTFDYSVLTLLLLCWGRAAWRFIAVKIVKRAADIWDSELFVAAAWSFISLGVLFMFYLRFHAISARYLMDLAAGFAVACAGGLMFKWRANVFSRVWHYGVLALFAVWWCWDLSIGKMAIEDYVGTQAEVAASLPMRSPELKPPPKRYLAADNPQQLTGIYRNGTGWQNPGGQAYYAVSLFFDSPQKISLLVTPRNGPGVSEDAYNHIQAKVGFEFLQRESMKDTPRGKLLVFAGPKHESYRHGIQLVSLGFISPDEFHPNDPSRSTSPFQLLEVSCDDAIP